MRRFAAVLVLLCGLAAPAPAAAVTLRDLIDLSKQGLGDELLIALVEAEKSVFHLTTADVKSLKEQGLSDRLLIHLLQTPSLRPEPESRLVIADMPAQAPAYEPAPVMIIERVETIALPVAVPVYVPVHVPRAPRRGGDRVHDRDRDGGETRRPAKAAFTQYWGYGGKLRPDAWGQPKKDPKKDPKEK